MDKGTKGVGLMLIVICVLLVLNLIAQVCYANVHTRNLSRVANALSRQIALLKRLR